MLMRMAQSQEGQKLAMTPPKNSETGTSAEQQGGVWLGTYTNGLGQTAVVTEECLTREQAHAAAERFSTKAKENSDRGPEKWRPHPKYPGRDAVYSLRRNGLDLIVLESR